MNSQLEIKLAPTPETDRRIITQDPRMCGCGYKSEIVFADFARRLERERDEARFDLAFRRELYAVQALQLAEARKTIAERRIEGWELITVQEVIA